MGNEENVPPLVSEPHVPHFTPLSDRTPLTPMQSALYTIRKRLEKQMTEPEVVADKVSPGLAQLRSTPGRMKDKQKILSRKHQEAKTKAKELNVGGGVSLWPEMDNMRLTKQEVINLSSLCCVLVLTVLLLFNQLHGSVMFDLDDFAGRLALFRNSNQLYLSDQPAFQASILRWHTEFYALMESVQVRFNIDLSQTCAAYKISAVLYVTGIGALFYYMIDNMFAKSKLTPKTIKIWVSLLVVIGTWTFLVVFLLIRAHRLELEVINNVHHFTEIMASALWSDVDLYSSRYHSMWLYWRTRCLPPTGLGTLRIMGLVPVQDVTLYLQYYSWPIVTALVTPVLKLVISLREVYALGHN